MYVISIIERLTIKPFRQFLLEDIRKDPAFQKLNTMIAFYDKQKDTKQNVLLQAESFLNSIRRRTEEWSKEDVAQYKRLSSDKGKASTDLDAFEYKMKERYDGDMDTSRWSDTDARKHAELKDAAEASTGGNSIADLSEFVGRMKGKYKEAYRKYLSPEKRDDVTFDQLVATIRSANIDDTTNIEDLGAFLIDRKGLFAQETWNAFKNDMERFKESERSPAKVSYNMSKNIDEKNAEKFMRKFKSLEGKTNFFVTMNDMFGYSKDDPAYGSTMYFTPSQIVSKIMDIRPRISITDLARTITFILATNPEYKKMLHDLMGTAEAKAAAPTRIGSHIEGMRVEKDSGRSESVDANVVSSLKLKMNGTSSHVEKSGYREKSGYIENNKAAMKAQMGLHLANIYEEFLRQMISDLTVKPVINEKPTYKYDLMSVKKYFEGDMQIKQLQPIFDEVYTVQMVEANLKASNSVAYRADKEGTIKKFEVLGISKTSDPKFNTFGVKMKDVAGEEEHVVSLYEFVNNYFVDYDEYKKNPQMNSLAKSFRRATKEMYNRVKKDDTLSAKWIMEKIARNYVEKVMIDEAVPGKEYRYDVKAKQWEGEYSDLTKPADIKKDESYSYVAHEGDTVATIAKNLHDLIRRSGSVALDVKSGYNDGESEFTVRYAYPGIDPESIVSDDVMSKTTVQDEVDKDSSTYKTLIGDEGVESDRFSSNLGGIAGKMVMGDVNYIPNYTEKAIDILVSDGKIKLNDKYIERQSEKKTKDKAAGIRSDVTMNFGKRISKLLEKEKDKAEFIKDINVTKKSQGHRKLVLSYYNDYVEPGVEKSSELYDKFVKQFVPRVTGEVLPESTEWRSSDMLPYDLFASVKVESVKPQEKKGDRLHVMLSDIVKHSDGSNVAAKMIMMISDYLIYESVKK